MLWLSSKKAFYVTLVLSDASVGPKAKADQENSCRCMSINVSEGGHQLILRLNFVYAGLA